MKINMDIQIWVGVWHHFTKMKMVGDIPIVTKSVQFGGRQLYKHFKISHPEWYGVWEKRGKSFVKEDIELRYEYRIPYIEKARENYWTLWRDAKLDHGADGLARWKRYRPEWLTYEYWHNYDDACHLMHWWPNR